MVAIFTGIGLGTERGSGFVLGSQGQLGNASFGRYGENVSVNAATGNLNIMRSDEILIGQGEDSDIIRAYNSMGPATDDNSDNWIVGNGRMITNVTGTINTAGSQVTRIDTDGSDTTYTYDATRGCYVSKQGTGAFDTLAYSYDPDTDTKLWTWTDGSTQVTETYTVGVNPRNSSDIYWGRIISSLTPGGGSTGYSWSGNKLVQVVTWDGDTVDLTWSTTNPNQLVSIGSTVLGGSQTLTSYTYDSSGRLATVTTDLTPSITTDSSVVTTTYTYDGASTRVASISQTGGAALAIAYETTGLHRVLSVTQTDSGSGASLITSQTQFSYGAGYTNITDALGNVTKLTYDSNDQLTRIDFPAGNYLAYAYDSSGNVTSSNDGAGNLTTYQYDGNGNMTLRKEALGSTTAWTYGAFNEVLTETDYEGRDTGSGPSTPHTTRYSYYPGSNVLHYVTSPEGEVTEYVGGARYPSSKIVYRDATYNVSSLGVSTSIAESALNSWVSGIADKSDAERTDYAYDSNGNVIGVKTYQTDSTAGVGLTTAGTYSRVAYTYDRAGNMLTKTVLGVTNTEVFTYDGLNRVLTAVDFNAGTTSYAYNDGANTTTITLADGLQQVATYNKAGQLIQYKEHSTTGISPDRITAYAYDTDGNLRMVTDPAGAVRYMVYDADGRKSLDITADGELTQYFYTAAGLLQTTIEYANRRTPASLAALLVDGSGNPLNPALSALLPAQSTDPNNPDHWTWQLYDNEDRPLETINADGDAEQHAFDALGLDTLERDFTQKLTSYVAGFKTTAPTTFIAPSSSNPVDQAYINFFNADTQVTGRLNLSTGALTQYTYDAAGNLVDQITYANPVAISGIYATVTASIVPNAAADIHSRFIYDDQGNLTYSIDSQLNVTQYAYDSAGHVLHTTVYDGAITAPVSGGYTATYVASQVASHASRTTYTVYDAAGRAAFIIDAAGDVTANTYDTMGRLTKQVQYATTRATTSDPALATMASWVTANTTANDRATRNFYDDADNLIFVEDSGGYVTKYVYDLDKRVTQTIRFPASYLATITDSTTFATMSSTFATALSGSLQTTMAYDVDGRMTDMTDAAGIVTHTVYDAFGNASAVTVGYGTPDAATTNYVYDAVGRLVKTTSATGAVTSCTYDGAGNVLSETDGVGNTTTYTYDAAGQVLTRTDALGHVTTNVYDALGHLIQTTDANSNKTYYFYDNDSRLILTVDPEGAAAKAVYNSFGEVIETVHYATEITAAITAGTMPTVTTSSSDIATYTDYDSLGRAYLTIDGEGYVTQTAYNAFGNVTSMTRYAANVTGTITAGVAPTVTTTAGADATTSYGYDLRGERTSETDPTSHSQSSTFDAFGRVSTSTDRMSGVAHYTYDGDGRVLTAQDAAGNTTTYQYNARGKLVLVTDANLHKTYYFYDGDGRLTLTIGGEGAATANTYNADGRVIKTVQYATKVTAAITADVPPTLTTSSADITTYIDYDADGRQQLTIDGQGYATKTGYDADGNVNLVTHYATAVTGTITPGVMPTLTTAAADEITSFTFGGRNEVTSQTDAELHTTHFTYDTFGNRATVVNELGATTTYAYDRRGLMVSATLPVSANVDGGAAIVNKYTYDARGNLTKTVEAFGRPEARTTIYAFDLDDRTISKTEDLAQALVSSSTYLPVAAANPVTLYVYDANGNLIEQTDPNTAHTFYYYDAANRKIASLNAVGTLSTWQYDGVGNVTRERVYGDVFTLPSTPGGAPPSTASTNLRETDYTYYKNDQLKTTTVTGVLYWQNGMSGSPATGNAVITNTYDAFGNMTVQQDARSNNTYYYYDKRGDKIAQVDQNLFLTAYSLDLDGNVLTETRYATALSAAPGSTTPTGTSNANDRITNFVYDHLGRRTSETRLNVAIGTINTTTGGLTTSTVNSVVSYTYDALGDVKTKTEATGDVTTYTYDTSGRLTSTAMASFADYTGTSVSTTTTESYDGLNNLVSSVENGTRATSYVYDKAGRVVSMTDAGGNVHTYGYDLAGHMLLQGYTRLRPDGTTVLDADLFSYDAIGQVTSQSVAERPNISSSWVKGDVVGMTYDAWGEVTARGIHGLSQETFAYDNAGRLTRSVTGDGTAKYFLYDLNGEQTAMVTTDGTVPTGYSWSTMTLTDVIGRITNSGAASVGAYNPQGMVMTFTTYDARGQVSSTVSPFRQLSETVTASSPLVASKHYNAFGEVSDETDANGNTTTYAYNTMGKLTLTTLPAVVALDQNGNRIYYSGTTTNENPTFTTVYDASGRAVATIDANGKTTTRTLLAGSGYDGTDALVVETWNADSLGQFINRYDVNRDMRQQSTSGVVSTPGALAERDMTFTYDALDRVATQTDPAGTNTDSYTYDVLGERLKHTNTYYGSTVAETTWYDLQGRVIKAVDMDGNATTYTYTWQDSAAINGFDTTAEMGTGVLEDAGGWQKVTVNASGLSETEVDDYYGHTVSKSDFGGVISTYYYDQAGRINFYERSGSGALAWQYKYLNTGLLGESDYGLLSYFISYTLYGESYDKVGNVTGETVGSYYGGGIFGGAPSTTITETKTATYDADNRMTDETDTTDNGTTIHWDYDLAGNIRHMHSTYHLLDATAGTPTATAGAPEDYWYTYDGMNRFVISKGFLAAPGGTITIGTTGNSVTYNGDGSRATMTDTSGTETYTYNADGYLSTVKVGGVLRASYGYDTLNRATSYTEYQSDGATVAYSRSTSFDADSLTTSDTVTQRQTSGVKVVTASNYSYTDTVSGAANSGVVTSSSATTRTYNASGALTSTVTSNTANTYAWVESAEITDSKMTPSSGPIIETEYYYGDGYGHLTGIVVDDYSTSVTRAITFINDVQGQIVQRTEELSSGTTPAAVDMRFTFDGLVVGEISNDGTSNVDYAQSIAAHQQVTGSGVFRNGASSGTSAADFDQNYDAINGNDITLTNSSYTVTAGDTLQSIAASVWGDASLWYLIADANGITDSTALVAGTTLVIPNKVANVHNNATTFKAYDPNEAIGDINTNLPHPKPKGNNCGVFGQIILAVIAIAVTIFLPELAPETFEAMGPILSGVVSAVAGSVVSQGIGLATGIQKSFSWSAVAMAALTAGTNGVSSLAITGEGILAAVGRAVLSNVLTQGVELATGLEKKFDWAGVAAAGVGAGVATGVGEALGTTFSASGAIDLGKTGNQIANGLITGAARIIASSATKSLINGSDFGDNIMAALPSMIGSVVGTQIGKWLGAEFGPVQFVTVTPARVAPGSISGTGTETAASGATPPQGTPVAVPQTPNGGVDLSAFPNLAALSGIENRDTLIQELVARHIAFTADSTGQLTIYEQSSGPQKGAPVLLRDITDQDAQDQEIASATAVPVDFNAIYTALNYDAGTARGASLIQRLFDDKVPIIPTIGATQYDTGKVMLPGTQVDLDQGDKWGELNAVLWNPTIAVKSMTNIITLPDGKYAGDPVSGAITPALALIHEIDHADGYSISPIANWALDHTRIGPTYQNLEEERVMPGLTLEQVNNAMGSFLGNSSAVQKLIGDIRDSQGLTLTPDQIRYALTNAETDAGVAETIAPDSNSPTAWVANAGNGAEKVIATELGEQIRPSHVGEAKIVSGGPLSTH